MRNPDIALAPHERALFAEIRFNWQTHDELRSSLAPMESLASSILERGAVPEIRIAYFIDPQFNLGGRGQSRKEIFEKNGTSGDEILRHPHFLKHLEYFVCGPDLPAEAIEQFESKASGGHLSGSDIADLIPYCRSCVRHNRLEPRHAADEFFKLTIECGAMPGSAESLVKAIRSIKLRHA